MKKIIKVLSVLYLLTNTIFAQTNSYIEYEFIVKGNCGMCEERIENTALKHEGVASAEWNSDTQMLTISIDESQTSISRVKYNIAQAGHDNGSFKAPQEVYDNMHGCCKYREEESDNNSSNINTPVLMEYTFRVEGACGMCKERIENTATLHGAQSAEWDWQTNMLTIVIDESQLKISTIKNEIALAGHDNGSFKTPEEVYENLPGCCQYRELDENQKSHDEMKSHTLQSHSDNSSHNHLHTIEGFIYGPTESGNRTPLIGANVTIGDSGEGVTTDLMGYFKIDNSEHHANSIQISYIGFETQTISLEQEGFLDITLNNGHQLDAVEVVYKKRTTEVSFIKAINSENITREELCKAACCNLSESFETNPSVDVSFPDAVTGTRQIQMLGLAGPYVQITRELMPDVRAMSTIYGLSMTPGPWIESIQLIKGAGSVVNGFESLTGQINVELKKPERGDLLFLNGYLNNGGRVELNANLRRDVSKNVSTGLLLHAKSLQSVHDNNGDSFTDMPLERDMVVANRWKFKRVNNFEGQLGVKYSRLSHEGGSHDHFSGTSQDHESHWRMNSLTNRYEAWAKIGYVNEDAPENSIGLQLSAIRQDQDSEFGNDIYDNTQNSVFANLIFQRIPNDNHIIRTGLTYQLDDIDERVGRAGVFDRFESIPGAYFEYTYKEGTKWSIIPGIRADWHNNYGVFVTPRLHAKYNFNEKSIIRFSLGRGQRTASIFAENLGLFSSSREVNIVETNTENPYGLNPEVAWNYGINFTKAFDISNKELVVSFDAYRTSFENQIIVDYETAGRVSFYNLDGSSYSNSVQLKLEYPILNNFDIRMAYRMFDVKTTYGESLLEKPLVAKHRAFINMAYKTDNDWHFDATLNWNGQKRLPNTSNNPVAYQRPDRSPDYFLLNAQIMKRWGTKWDVYLGAENLLNYKQNDAIIAGDDAFGQFFDASIVWAPLFGANIYLGFRYTITGK